VHLLLGDLDLFQRSRDLVEGEEAPLVSFGDQRTQLIQLVDGRLVRQQNLLDRTAPL